MFAPKNCYPFYSSLKSNHKHIATNPNTNTTDNYSKNYTTLYRPNEVAQSRQLSTPKKLVSQLTVDYEADADQAP
jgi:hypothetical protein